MFVNFSQLKAKTGIDLQNETDLLYYAKSLLDYLESHNKNYTKEQYSKILTLYDILTSIEED